MNASESVENVLVNVNVIDSSAQTLVFREACGTATMDGVEGRFEVSHHVATGAPIVRLPNGSFAVFPWPTLICAAIEASKRHEVCQR
jgi:hypothetical protein